MLVCQPKYETWLKGKVEDASSMTKHRHHHVSFA